MGVVIQFPIKFFPKKLESDVHVEHCCLNCGCKYGDDIMSEDGTVKCPVVAGLKMQKISCDHGACK